MKIVSMSGSLRENVGKKDAKKMRKAGLIPSVIYGGKEQHHIAIPAKDFKHLVFSPEIAFVNIDVDGTVYKAILQDIQYHPVTDNIMHADFLELIEGKQIVMGVPVKTTGTAPGILAGGKLQTKLRKIKIKALPEDMPESVTLDISELNIGNGIKVKEVEVPNASLLDAPNAVVVAVKVTRAAASAGMLEDGEEGTEEGAEESEATEKTEE